MRRAWLLLFLVCPVAASADDSARLDPTHPYRTDSANDHLPWYQVKPGEFPPQGSEHRLGGELVEADFIHRTGQFRSSSGELVNFTLLPFGTVKYLNAEADLRDVPLGSYFEFFLYRDAAGAFNQVALMQDEYTLRAAEGLSYRLDAIDLDHGKLEVTRQNLSRNQADLGHSQLLVGKETRVWKGEKQVPSSDLAVGDELLANLTDSRPDHPGTASDIWVGAETHKLATEQQRKKHVAFLKQRGLPAWIDRVDGKKLTVTLFGDPAGLQSLCKDEGIVPQQWATENRYIDVVVANQELRSYNPPVDRQRSLVQQFEGVATDCFGSSGVRWIIEPGLLIEGFRKGRVVRLFAHPSWPVEDMPFGESIYSEAPGIKAGLEEPDHYPYRTDFANEQLPWYRLQPGVFPPTNSHHLVSGELTKVDTMHRLGQFRAEGSGELVDFTMPPFGYVMYLNAMADLGDVPLGTRCGFYLYQDDHGSFTRAAVITDEFTRMANDKMTYRLAAARLQQGKLLLATQLGKVRNYKEDLVRPPDVGHGEFSVDDQTRVWKGDQQVKLSDLAVEDELLVNQTGRTATSRGRLTDIWVGPETHKRVSDQQVAKHNALLKQQGLAAWIDRVEGQELTITFFAGPSYDFQTLFHDGPPDRKVCVLLADEQRSPAAGAIDVMTFKEGRLDEPPLGTYGCRGTHWKLESAQQPEGYRQGQIVRVFEEGWPAKKILDGRPAR